ncbi:hypothetical protein OIE66_30290 [Nonomuraea sp. NBC_01738]|uniref:hypothetical protein n=1 Tax=Nonomuraea sp. NBC_01738 TaxID=2976003 RepID=UPI002E125464|nr:hypothetical protein OIE66_30290 [Nonomuraea sp. NBC_01738]
MSLLEKRYRSTLRVLPAAYRAEREEEMVSAYLEYAGDVPDERGPRPRFGEIASVLALAVRVRLGGHGAAARYVAWGDAVRLVARYALLYKAATAVLILISMIIATQDIEQSGPPMSAERTVGVLLALVECLWLVSYVALVRGAARTAKLAALAGLLAYVAELTTVVINHDPLRLTYLIWGAVPVLALFGAYHRDAPPPRHSWVRALYPPLAGAALIYAGQAAVGAIANAADMTPELAVVAYTVFGQTGQATLAVLVLAVLYLARGSEAATLLGVAILATVLLALRLIEVLSPVSQNPGVLPALAIQSALLAVMAFTLAITGLRKLPALPYLRERPG